MASKSVHHPRALTFLAVASAAFLAADHLPALLRAVLRHQLALR